jgi:hypothetical protein
LCGLRWLFGLAHGAPGIRILAKLEAGAGEVYRALEMDCFQPAAGCALQDALVPR